MAKKNGNWWKIVGAIGVIAGILAAVYGVVYAHGEQARAVQDTEKHVVELEKTTTENIATLKEDGCDPAGEVKDRVLILETDNKYTKESLKKLETGQTTMQETMQKNQTVVLEAINAIKEK